MLTPAPDDTILKTIQGWQWFADVPLEAQQWLAAHASVRQIPKGKVMYAPGDVAHSIYGVISGVFRIYLSTPRGDELTMEEVVPGGWFSHGYLQAIPKYLTHCVCQQSASVVVVPYPALLEFAERWPGFYKGLYHEFIARAVATFGRIELLSLHNLNVRLAVYFLRLARLRGQTEPGGAVWIAGEESQTELGARVGGTRQRVNSVLKAWIRRGLIEQGKDGIRVLDVTALKQEATKTGFDIEAYLAGWHGGWQGANNVK